MSQMLKSTNQNFEYILKDLHIFLIASFDTISHALTISIYALDKFKEVWEKLKSEVLKVIKSQDDITRENIDEISYLTYFFNEAIRFDEPAPRIFPVEAKANVEINGVNILKGTWVNLNFPGLAKNKNEWQSPDKFIPERWDPTSPYFKTPSGKNRSFNSLGTFGFGIRRCPGEFLAKLEAKIFLIFIILNYWW